MRFGIPKKVSMNKNTIIICVAEECFPMQIVKELERDNMIILIDEKVLDCFYKPRTWFHLFYRVKTRSRKRHQSTIYSIFKN